MAKNRSIAIATTTTMFIILLIVLRRRDARSSANGSGAFATDDGSISSRRSMRMLPGSGDQPQSAHARRASQPVCCHVLKILFGTRVLIDSRCRRGMARVIRTDFRYG